MKGTDGEVVVTWEFDKVANLAILHDHILDTVYDFNITEKTNILGTAIDVVAA